MNIDELLEHLKVRMKVLEWLINGHGRLGIPISSCQHITPEWIVNNYNVEMSYFNDSEKNNSGYLFDNSEDARQKRKDENTRIRALAEKAWEDMNNEGDNTEKSYWIHGFCVGYNSKEAEDESKT